MHKLIDTTTFIKDFKFVDGYDDLVKSSDGKIYKANYKGMKVELLEMTTDDALNKIETGLMQFVNMLKKDLEFIK
jgi:hypothetical protein